MTYEEADKISMVKHMKYARNIGKKPLIKGTTQGVFFFAIPMEIKYSEANRLIETDLQNAIKLYGISDEILKTLT